MNGGGAIAGKSIISIANSNSSTRTLTAGNGGPVVKVSGSQSQIIQGPNGSVTLMVASSSSSTSLIESQSPNVSVPILTNSSTTGKRVGPKGTGHNAKERRAEAVVAGGSTGSNSKDKVEITVTAGGTPETDLPKDVITLKSDLRNIMHAFGDDCMPLEESVHLMEVILRQEMKAFLFICDQAAELRGTKILGLRECIYAMKSDKSNLSRLFKYLTAKDRQEKKRRKKKVTQSIKFTVHTKTYLSEIKEILDEFDDFGQLGQLLVPFDPENCMENSDSDSDSETETEIASRADRINLRLNNEKMIENEINNEKFLTYAKARSVSFARKLSQLQEWTATHLHSEYKLTPTFIEVLAFLIYEMVAQIVDLAFIIKRERNGNPDHIQRLMDSRGVNPDTCMSALAFQKKRKDDAFNKKAELLVQASELEAKRLKKVMLPNSNKEAVNTKGVHCLSPCEIREAYLRLRRSPVPSSSYVSRAERICQLNFQY